jgi:hypothetical protein
MGSITLNLFKNTGGCMETHHRIFRSFNFLKLLLVLLMITFISFGCGGGGGDASDSADVLQPTKIIYSEISGDSDLIAMVTNDEGDIVGVVSNNDRQSVTGGFYVLPDESQERKYMMLEFGEDDLPASISFPDGSIYTFSNYTENSVDILLTNPDGSEIGPETVNVSASDLTRLRDLITAGVISSSELTADVWNAVGLSLSIGGCAITSATALGSGDTAVSIASASCVSNIINTIDSATESNILNNTGETLNIASCASTPTDNASILSCLTHLTDEVALNQNKWPIVVSTSPADGETNVSSDLNTISITFSKRMAGLPYYGFTLTCDGCTAEEQPVWPNASLQWSADGKTFSISRGNAGTPLPSGITISNALNPTDYTPAFRDINGNPLPPYYLSFKVSE